MMDVPQAMDLSRQYASLIFIEVLIVNEFDCITCSGIAACETLVDGAKGAATNVSAWPNAVFLKERLLGTPIAILHA